MKNFHLGGAYGSGVSGIYIDQPSKEVEVIEPERVLNKNKISEQIVVIQNTFQRMYDEGWVIENSESFGNFARYFMKRSKQG